METSSGIEILHKSLKERRASRLHAVMVVSKMQNFIYVALRLVV